MYGVVIADDSEFLPVIEYAKQCFSYTEGVDHGNPFVCFENSNGKKIKAVCCGIGKVNSAAAASFLAAEQVEAVVNIGLSGSVEKAKADGIVIGSSFVEADFDLTVLGYDEFAKPGQTYIYKADDTLLRSASAVLPNAKIGALACGDKFLTDAKRGEYLNQKYGISAYDMESGAIASVCYKCNIPFIAIRQISDSADDNAPEEYTENNDQSKPDLLKAMLLCLEKYDEVKSVK